MPTRKSSLILRVTVALVLLVLYVGTYYAMVEPEIVSTIGVPGDFPPMWQPTYSAGPMRDIDGWYFAPIHRLDRRLRPHVWNP